MKTNKWKSITASLALVIILIQSCKVTEGTYRKVATDTKVTSEKKAIIAPWVSVYFPVSNEVIKGDDIVTTDTMWVAYSYTDSIHFNDTVIQRVTKTVYRTDTVKTEDYSKLLISRRENTQLQADIVIQHGLRRQAENNLNMVKSEKRNLIYWIIGLCIALLASIYFHIRRII